MRIGAHVPRTDPLAAAAERDADLVQIFLSDPQSWKPPPPREDADALRASPIPVIVHAPYLVNVASPNNRIRVPSRRILQETCDAAAAVGATAVVVHGGYVGEAGDVAAGIGAWVKALERLETDLQILIENTAGGTGAMARRFDVLAALFEAIRGVRQPDVGFCLDTCHAHAAGEGLLDAVDRLLATVGRIDLVHCNDSKDAAGSGRDRHEHLGQGRIVPELLVAVCAAAGADVVVETPAAGQRADVAWLRERLPVTAPSAAVR